MDFGGVDRRKTKGDLKRKRLARGYKRGGKFRSAEVDEKGSKEVAHDSVPSRKDTKVSFLSGKTRKVVEKKKRGKFK